MKKISNPLLLTLLCLTIVPIFAVNSAVPRVISYQGKVDDSGSPLDTTVDITFTLYLDSSGTTDIWSEVHSSVPVTGGLFYVLLGSVDSTGNPLSDSLFNNPDLFLGIQIGASSEITPRTKLASVPFAYHASTADVALSVSQSGSDWFVGGDLSDLYNGNGQLTAFPPDEYEYGFKFLGPTVHRAICTFWNSGLRFYNIEPFFVDSDNPSAGMKWGGVIFYINTLSSDDDAATPTNWRHGYWHLDPTDAAAQIKIFGSLGNSANSVYCRKL